MIVGVDHIGLTAKTGLPLEWLGYSERFSERRVPNPRAKEPFLRAYRPVHDITYFDAPDLSPAIEVVDEGTRHERSGDPFPTIVVDRAVTGATAAPPEVGDAVSGALGYRGEVAVGFLPNSRLPVVSAPNVGARVAAYIVAVRDVEASASLWAGGLGLLAPATDPGGRWAHLRLVPPVPRWRVNVILFAGRGEPMARYLDEEAITSIAFLSTDVTSDRERLARQGVEVGDIFHLGVNGRDLKIALGRTSDGDVIELIQVMPKHESDR